MRVFTALPTRHWSDAADAARRAEAAGFDGAMTVELGHDAMTPLAFAGLATERLELSPSILVAFPRSPTVLAMQAWDMHANSGGRFVLGIGSQVKGHNERRYGVAWSAPAPRLEEYIGALRAVWRTWETGEPLDFRGEHYKLTLMTPDFSPEPTGLPPIPIHISAVGDAMLRLAGKVCDGVRLHPLCTRRYLEEACMPQIETGMARSGRTRDRFDIWGGGFIVTGPDEAALARGRDFVRKRVSLYCSTRTYMPILKLHGLEELGLALHRMTVENRWNDMPGLVSDDVVDIFCTSATYDGIAAEVARRWAGSAVDTIELNLPEDVPTELATEIVADIRRIPHGFGAVIQA